MAKYTVEVEWSGYSRGISTYEVEAESKEDAGEDYWSGTEVYRETIRDDTEGEVVNVTEITTPTK